MKMIRNATLALALFASPAMAQETFSAEVAETCGLIHTLAEQIMTLRQRGVSMGEVINALGAVENPEPRVQAMSESIVLMAYESPDLSSPDNEDRAITEFANDIEVMCFSTLR